MSQAEQRDKGVGKKLGRGLSALLGTPVSIRVPPTPAEGVVREVVETITALTPQIMQEDSSQSSAVAGGIPSPSAKVSPGTTPVGDRQRTPESQPSDSRSLGDLREIPVEQIIPNPRQPRTDFDQTSIDALAASIRLAGLMQPIMVRPTVAGYELIAGERRWRAAKLLGLRTIPALVRQLDDEASAELALIENIHREDLNPMDRALALRRLSDDFSLTHQQLAERVGLDRPTVTNLLRLSDLDPATADMVRSGVISQSHGKALLAIESLKLRADMAQRAAKEEWSVRELERRVQQVNSVNISGETTYASPATEPSPRTANVVDLERKLAEHLGTKVSIQLGRKKGSGRLIVEFYSLDQFDGLMSRLGFGAGR